MNKKDYKNNFNCIIILKKSVLEAEFSELEKDLVNALKKINLIKE